MGNKKCPILRASKHSITHEQRKVTRFDFATKIKEFVDGQQKGDKSGVRGVLISRQNSNSSIIK
jgi:hypothetical protein